jgi:hypothetical protein
MRVPPISMLHSILFDEEQCLMFLFHHGAFYTSRECESCHIPMIYYQTQKAFKCPKKHCRKTMSFKANSFFSHCRLPCSQVLHLAYLWLSKASMSTTQDHTGHTKQTICDYFKYFRELVSSFPMQEERMIGGDGVIVELDGAKLGKRKYNKGHHVEGVWILGGVERTPERKTFFCASFGSKCRNSNATDYMICRIWIHCPYGLLAKLF